MIALSFDIEEFDLPLEHGVDLPFERQIEISREGAMHVLDILERQGVKATFYSTVNFADNAPCVISRLISGGHELASHGMRHSGFEMSDLQDSRLALEKIARKPVNGYRQPRMMKLDESDVAKAGYLYDSSLNPTFIPGRYMNLSTPRRPFMKDGVLQIPASVTPLVRFPLFWLAAHVLPAPVYRTLALRTLKHDGLFNTYFHPWEFYDLSTLKGCRIPAIVRRNAGEGMRRRLEELIVFLKKNAGEFVTYSQVYEAFRQSNRK